MGPRPLAEPETRARIRVAWVTGWSWNERPDSRGVCTVETGGGRPGINPGSHARLGPGVRGLRLLECSHHEIHEEADSYASREKDTRTYHQLSASSDRATYSRSVATFNVRPSPGGGTYHRT